MIPHPLDGPRTKIDRAARHAQQLSADVMAFCALRPFAVDIQRDVNAAGDTHFIARESGPVLSLDVPLLAGECAYQLRSALDHLIHQLVIANGNQDKLTSRRHQFPIFATLDGFDAKANAMINGVSDSARALIEAAQPYARPAADSSCDLLWLLQDLNNTDKHRLIPVSLLALGELRVRTSADDVTFADRIRIAGNEALQDGALLLRLEKDRHGDPYLDARLDCVVAFRSVGGLANAEITTLMPRIVNHVRKLIASFDGEFS